MKGRKLIPDPLLMVISIAGITLFLLYWLKENYKREERTLSVKAEIIFRETVQQLQVSKLKLGGIIPDSMHHGKVKFFVDEKSDGQVQVKMTSKDEIASTINVIREKLKDSIKKMPDIKAGMVISVKNNNFSFKTDTLHFENRILHEGPGSQIIQLLYGVDSLQDSLRLPEITSAYAAAMKQQKLDVPFIITRLDSCAAEKEDGFNTATVGFAKPVTYKIKLGNTFPYLFRQITQPVLFSILLLGITVLAFLLLYKNLTKQRKLAELKNEFISNITHELKTPIATVGVAIEALKNFNAMDDPKRTREYLDISQHELQRLGLLVDKVLKLSMFEKKEMDMRYEAVNLEDIVNEVVESMRLQVEKYRATITTAYDGDTTLMGDRLHLLSVVFNLLDNALKYSKEDPAIRISLEENEGTVKLIITDNGIGIAEEYKDKIFEKFFRVPHGNTHNAKGYGLGLSYVSGVVEKHRGSISVESKPGAGTSFIITLPKQQA